METFFIETLELLVNVAHAQAQIYVGPTLEAVSRESAPGEIIRNIYNLSLMLGGILAFGMIVFGAVKYTIASGNPSGQSDARDVITQALLGLLLLMGAFIVLNLIDPSLTRLDLPILGKIEGIREGVLPATGLPVGMCGLAASPVACESLSAAVACKTNASCSAYPGVANSLAQVQSNSGISITVTEAMPPMTTHESAGHRNGCSVDIRVEGVSDSSGCGNVDKVVEAAKSSGFSVANEYPFCPGGAESTFSTAPHLHLTKSVCP